MIQLASDLILITASITSTSLALLGVLPLDTSWSASTEWRLEAEVNVLLGVQADDEGWDVDDRFLICRKSNFICVQHSTWKCTCSG